MSTNRGVAYLGDGNVEIQSIDFPKLSMGDRQCNHGVILKTVVLDFLLCHHQKQLI